MPDLIIMPKSRNFAWHIHQQDNQFHGVMSRQNPTPMNEVVDFSQDLSEIVSIWGDELHGHTMANPRTAFWSLDEIREWVREHARSDVYANQHQGISGSLYVCSTDKASIDALAERSRCTKNHRIETRMDSLLSDEVSRWIQENCADKTDITIGWPQDGSRQNTYSFRLLDDATLFTVRWKGHGALEILSPSFAQA